MAAERRWPIRNDHCFQRVLLDAVFGNVWYSYVAARPAYRALSDAELARAVGLAEVVEQGVADLPGLNSASLAYRGR